MKTKRKKPKETQAIHIYIQHTPGKKNPEIHIRKPKKLSDN
jgi:hypothetical protein